MRPTTTTPPPAGEPRAASRRSFLAVTVGVLASGALNAVVSPGADAAARLELRAADVPLLTMPGAEDTLRVPRHLALEVVSGDAVPAGTEIEVRFDPRLFHALEQPFVLTAEGAGALEVRRGPADSPGRITVALPRSLKGRTSSSGPAAVLVLASANAPYPGDLVRAPAASAASLRSRGRTVSTGSAAPLAQPRVGGAPRPWGVDLSGTWRPVAWGPDGRWHTSVPGSVCVRSTGPGPLATLPALEITLDRRVVRSVEISSVRLNGERVTDLGRLRSHTLGNSLRVAWQGEHRLRANDLLECDLDVACVTPSGPLPGFFHPVVAWAGHPSAAGQRLTMREEWMRQDCVVE